MVDGCPTRGAHKRQRAGIRRGSERGRCAHATLVGVEHTAPTRLLWLLRHAKTLTDPPKGGGDHDRALAPRGTRDANALGARLGPGGDALALAAETFPQLVLSSDAVRTEQTTRLVWEPTPEPPTLVFDPALYSASPEEVMATVGGVDDEVTSMMVVGHNPTAHELALGLGLSPQDRKPVERAGFPTCSLAVFSFDVDHWHEAAQGAATLVALFTPPY